jgi:hypothetical protein
MLLSAEGMLPALAPDWGAWHKPQKCLVHIERHESYVKQALSAVVDSSKRCLVE